jgi:ATP/maltotriose-dependent transcriptional regulator MalT
MITALLAQALAYGPASVDGVIRRCDELLAGAGGDRPLRAALQSTLGGLHAMRGDFDVARRLYADAVAVYDELGLRVRRLSRAIVGAQVVSLAGDLDAAERELRSAYDALGASGERGLRSTLGAFLADLLCGRGRDDEAEALAGEASAGAAEHDVVPQLLSRSVHARVLARRGETDEAEALAREAHRRAGETDFVDLRAGVLLSVAEVVEAAGEHGEARSLREEARALYLA